jgi:hypothetical protein
MVVVSLTEVADTAMSIWYIFQTSKPDSVFTGFNPVDPYFSISLSLNVLLTLMIIVRVAWHGRNVRKITGALSTTSGLYSTIITMLVESCALYAAAFLLFLVPWWANSVIAATFWPVLNEIQVCEIFIPL